MDRDGFWGLVEGARGEVDDSAADPDGVADALTRVLGGLGAEEIAGFGVELAGLLAESYRWDLWAAAYLINGGGSEDGFDSFRGWLVAQGREVWEAAMAEPDSLADVVDEDRPEGFEGFDGEGMLHVGSHAYKNVTGDDAAYWKAVEAEAPDTPDLPAGQEIDFDDEAELHDHLPRLAVLYLDS
ncbi:DUF4240 domain-containing protein [Kribbella sandramycini]|uniref:DUF4240 domain-containing protein n=1 Tax=Kribbella sandramycini TaxID=60450 RepID=A0A7Y4L2M9_9ACTN|nr:hypothetical protein [Kribbella sandramycini]NOL42061.1 DUF4240 domain-containing protein [Kribbella sandramycini]